MHLNIKNDEAHDLAQRVARLAGESLTTAVTEALRERLERLSAGTEPRRTERLLAIGHACAERLPEPYGTAPHGDLLYDERGLPR